MATQSAPFTWSRTPGATSPRPRPLWQVPVFLAGLLALGSVCLLRVRCGPADRDLAAARELMAQPDCPLDRLEACLAQALAEEDRVPRRAGEAHFLLGTACLRRAGAATDGGRAAADWQRARAHLERAEELGVAEEDRPHLDYRLGQVWFHTGGDPQRVVDYLARSVGEAADDPAEGYALLTQAYLRLPQPDVPAALAANSRQLQLPAPNAEVLAPARLLRGELLLRLQKPDEAREVLKSMGPPVAPELLRQARSLEARTYQAEDEWATAARLWTEALAQPGLSGAAAAECRYDLGLCEKHLGQTGEAVRDLEKARAEAPPEVAQAAEAALASLRLQGPTPQTAMENFRRLVHDVHGPADWHNNLVDLAGVQKLFECGCAVYHESGRHELAMELAGLYQPLAPPGVAPGLYARSAEAEARELLDSAPRTQPESAARSLFETAQGLFREAGRTYEAAAEAAATPAERGERLASSATCFVHGGDSAAAIPVLWRWLDSGPPADQVGKIWFRLGEAHRNLHQEDEARAAYWECLKQRGPAVCRARYELALLEAARGDWDTAADNLDENLKQLQTAPDAEVREKTLFALGDLHFKRRNFLPAARVLEKGLAQYPNSDRAPVGRSQLAECYRSLAAQESQNLRPPERLEPEPERPVEGQYRAWLEKATACEEIVRGFADRLGAGPLPDEEEALYRGACTAAAECRSDLGDDQAAVRLYEPLAARYHHRVEGLAALAGMARCYWRKGKNDEARKTLERIRAELNEMEPSAFPSQPGSGTKADWEEWLRGLGKS